MCGITGALSFTDTAFEVTEPYITRMRDTMAHRGPDGAGTWISDDRRVGLGHRRLSIIDLSDCAAQPMCNEDASLWVVFNGEIYNHAEIRTELERFGHHHWKTDHSDTEVILHAFEQWGIDCIHRFRGMFAIVLWDARNRELWLIRDRIGIKPLCYSIHHGRIVFASEIKALLLDPDQERAVNEEAFYHYLSFLTTPAPNTLFQGIRKLAAGTWMRVREDGDIQERRYWDVWDHTTPLVGLSEEEIAKLLLQELRVAVRLRKISDVPVGVFLSGGIDSSTNAALFSEGDGRPVKTFSIGYDNHYGSYPSELRFARRMAEEVGAEHHERLLTQDHLIDFLPDMVRLQDEPIADPVCVPLYYVSKLSRDNGVMDQGFPYEWLRRGVVGQPVFWGGAEALTENQKKGLISARLRRKFANLTSWQALIPIRQRFEQKAWEKSHVNWMTYLDLNLRLPELLLMRVDKMSMGVGLEGRVPFLDHKFVELAMSIPGAAKTRGGQLKHILKASVRGLIPDELVDRKKQGFGVPVYEWFMDKLGNYARRELASFCGETDFLDREAVLRLVESRELGLHAWCLLNFALWWREYFQKPPQSEEPAVNIRAALPIATRQST